MSSISPGPGRHAPDVPDSRDDALPPGASEEVEFYFPLVWLTVVAAWLDVVLGRGLLRVIGGTAHSDHAALVETASRFVRNLAGVAAMVGLLAVAHTTLRSPRLIYGGVRRLFASVMFGVFLPVIGIALVQPEHKTTVVLLLIGIASSSLITLTLCTTAFSRYARAEQRVACALALVLSLAALGQVVFQVGTALARAPAGLEVMAALRNATEISYFALPVSFALGLLVWAPRGPSRRQVALAVCVAGAIVGGLMLLARVQPEDYFVLIYGALHLEALDTATPSVYALLIGVSVGAGVLGLGQDSHGERRIAAGTLLVLAAGAGPRAPIALATMMLGVACVSFASRPPRD